MDTFYEDISVILFEIPDEIETLKVNQTVLKGLITSRAIPILTIILALEKANEHFHKQLKKNWYDCLPTLPVKQLFCHERPLMVYNYNLQNISKYIDISIWTDYRNSIISVPIGNVLNIESSAIASATLIATHCKLQSCLPK